MGEQARQVEVLQQSTHLIDRAGIKLEIVADEWCNTLADIKLFATQQAGHMIQIKTPDLGGINNSIEAVLYCKAQGVKAYFGGDLQ